jgi:hypothetical protein
MTLVPLQGVYEGFFLVAFVLAFVAGVLKGPISAGSTAVLSSSSIKLAIVVPSAPASFLMTSNEGILFPLSSKETWVR